MEGVFVALVCVCVLAKCSSFIRNNEMILENVI